MANVDLGRYRRLVQMFWDPEPTNDPSQDEPVWCLGSSYKLSKDGSSKTKDTSPRTPPPSSSDKVGTHDQSTTSQPPTNAPETPPESISSSFSSSLAYEEIGQDGNWPPAFLADFESKFWMTYRSDFQPIPRSADPKATSTLSFSMRLKSQLGDTSSLSSDSGWGCMIRSGQSLLANAMGMVQLGRGKFKCSDSSSIPKTNDSTDWRRGQLRKEERQLISLFADDPRAPYSIHSFVRHGATACGKYPGEWFGPSATARCIQ